jgi:hypothetical protein
LISFSYITLEPFDSTFAATGPTSHSATQEVLVTVNPTTENAARSLAIAVLVLALGIVPPTATAEVVRVEISSREVVSDAPEHRRTGPYEVIKGVIHLEVDPDAEANRQIADLKLAPRNSQGRVEFSTEFELHKPVDPDRGNHRLIYFVNNRGNKHGAGWFSYQAGKNWLYANGWSYLWCGWNVDVIEGDRKLNIQVPVATDNGKPLTGKVYTEIVSWADDPVPSMPLVWGGSVAPAPVTLDNATASLTKRKYRWEDPIAVPRERWSFARQEDGELVPDPGWLAVEGGIKPGWLYDLVYVARDPKITGLGLAAIRDVVSFFRYEEADETGFANPLAGVVDFVHAWGHSQSGRLLSHFVYQGFNADERRRRVFDGVFANCPGAGKGLFNSRFAQTTRHGSHLEDNLFPIDVFPFTTVEQVDPVTGERGDALARARAADVLPKMVYLNSATDYWTRGASLLHTDVEGTRDAAIDPSVRIYLAASKAHVDTRMGVIGRALLTALDEWVSRGIPPPDSRIPKIADGTLVTLEQVRTTFPAVPGVALPDSFYRPLRLDLGPRWHSQGIADNVPPKVGKPYGALVPQVDVDGNDIAGIRLPEIAVPVVTSTGWRLRNPSFSNTLGRNTGRVWPFPGTAEERERTGDPRPSIAERYPSRALYLARVVDHLVELRRQRFLLDEDVATLLEQAARQASLLHDLRPPEQVAVEDGAEATVDYLRRLHEADAIGLVGVSGRDLGGSVNSTGYRLMETGELETACELFRQNTVLYPDSWNTWDSLGECRYRTGDLDRSAEYYEKSLELNPDNHHATEMLQKIRSRQ